MIGSLTYLGEEESGEKIFVPAVEVDEKLRGDLRRSLRGGALCSLPGESGVVDGWESK